VDAAFIPIDSTTAKSQNGARPCQCITYQMEWLNNSMINDESNQICMFCYALNKIVFFYCGWKKVYFSKSCKSSSVNNCTILPLLLLEIHS